MNRRGRFRVLVAMKRRIFLGYSLAVALLVNLASAASVPKKAPPATNGPTSDSAPVLMSRTGGGKVWSNMAELQKAAKEGNPRAQAQLGERLLRGDEIAQDKAAGLALLEKAARAGESSAAFRIGMLLDDGDGVAQDRQRALAYFQAAAAGGANEAFHNIGAAYVSARGVKRNYAEGLAWLMIARKRGAASDGEEAVRARIAKLGHPEWIAAAEKRVPEIERELAAKKPIDFLPPPAPFLPATAK
jgi:TPR repeat protein